MGSGNDALREHFIKILQLCELQVSTVNFDPPVRYAADLYLKTTFGESQHNVWIAGFIMHDDHFVITRWTPEFTDCDATALYADPDYLDKILLSVANCSDYAMMLFKSIGSTKLHV